jgi:hypothetical protein
MKPNIGKKKDEVKKVLNEIKDLSKGFSGLSN